MLWRRLVRDVRSRHSKGSTAHTYRESRGREGGGGGGGGNEKKRLYVRARTGQRVITPDKSGDITHRDPNYWCCPTRITAIGGYYRVCADFDALSTPFSGDGSSFDKGGSFER